MTNNKLVGEKMRNSLRIFGNKIKRGLAGLLTAIVVITSMNLTGFNIYAATGDSEAEPYDVSADEALFSLIADVVKLANGNDVDASKEYSADTSFSTKISFTIPTGVISTISSSAADTAWFRYKLPDNIDTSGAFGTSGDILGSSESGTYEIKDGYVYFRIKKDYFNTHTTDVTVDFDYTFTVDESKISNTGDTDIEFPGSTGITHIKTEKPGTKSAYKANSSIITSGGKSYIPYTMAFITNSRNVSTMTITDTPGSNIDVDMASLKVKVGGTVIDPAFYEIVKSGSSFSIKLNYDIPANSNVSIDYNAEIKDTTLDANNDGYIDGIENDATWSVGENPSGKNISAKPQVGKSNQFAMDKGSSISGKTVNWNIAINSGAFPTDVSNFRYEDEMKIPAGVTVDYSAIKIYDEFNNDVTAQFIVSSVEGNKFSVVFPSNAGAKKYYIKYSTEITSDIANGESVILENTGITKDTTNTEVGRDVEKNTVTVNSTIGVDKSVDGAMEPGYIQGWKTVITPDAQDGLNKDFVYYDRLGTDTFYGSTFVEDSIVVKVGDSKTLEPGVDYVVTFEKSPLASAAGASGNDILKINFTAAEDFTENITISYKSQDDGSGMTAGKNLVNYCYVNDPKYSDTVYQWVTESNIEHSMGKSGKLSADGKTASWKVIVNAQYDYIREGIKNLNGKDIKIEDILPEGTKLIPSSLKVTLFRKGEWAGNAVTAFTDNSTDGKISITVPKETIATYTDNGYFIIHVEYDTSVATYNDLDNVAEYYADGKKQDTVKYVISQPEKNLLDKKATNNKTFVTYTIDVNPNEYDYFPGSDTMSLVDELPENANLVTTSIKVVDKNGNDLIAAGKVTYEYNTSTGKLSFVVPDGMYVIITYNMTPDFDGLTKNDDGTYDVSIVNKIKCVTGIKGESSGSPFSGKMSSSAATIKGRNLIINKVDGSNLLSNLGGATFKIQKFNTATAAFEDIVAADAITVDSEPYTTDTADDFETNASTGLIAYANLKLNTIYSFTESKAPAGYDKDTTVYYIILKGDAEVSNAALAVFEAAGFDSSAVKNILDDNKMTITNSTKNTTVVSIDKVDEDGTTALSGATLEVYKTTEVAAAPYDAMLDGKMYVKDTLVDDSTWVTNGAAHTIEGLEAGEVYILHEKTAPAGYKVAADVAFKVKAAGTVTEVKMKDEKTDVKVFKYEDGTTTAVEGATLTIKDKSTGSVIDTWITGTSAHEIKGKLVAGKEYVLSETKVPAGYKKAEDIVFTVDEEGHCIRVSDSHDLGTEIVMYDVTVNTVDIYKYKPDGTTLLDGAKLQIIKKSDGSVVKEWISKTTKETFTDLEAGVVYILREVQPPTGYTKAEDIEFTINASDKLTTVTMTDFLVKPSTLKIKKTDGTVLLAGAKLQLKDKDSNVVEEWVSTEAVKEIADLKAGKYIIHEVSAPMGYDVATDITVILEEGKTTEVTMEDVKKTAKLTITKVDETNTKLDGASLELYKGSAATPFMSWLTSGTNNPLELDTTDDNIVVGETYTLKEVTPPTGYQPATPVTFVLAAGKNDIKMIDVPVSVTELPFSVLKTNFEGQALAGANLSIYKAALSGSIYVRDGVADVYVDGSATSVTAWDSTDTAVEISGLETGYYFLVENTVPSTGNYEKAAAILFHYDKTTGTVITYKGITTAGVLATGNKVTMVDNYKPFHIEKRKTDGTVLAGAVLEIYKGTTLVKTLDSSNCIGGNDGTWDISKWDGDVAITAGSYVLKEKTVPDGYAKSEDISFTINSDMTITYSYRGTDYTKVTTMIMVDEAISFKVNKTDSLGADLSGATLNIYKDNAGTVGALVKGPINPNGPVTINGLSVGTYWLREDTTPPGYVTADDIRFDINEDGTVSYEWDGSAYKYENVKQINMVDKRLNAIVRKTDESDHLIEHAVIELRAADDTVIVTFDDTNDISGNEGSWDISAYITAGNTYKLVEISAPDGYKISEIINIEVESDGTINYTYNGVTYSDVKEITMRDVATSLTIQKVDEVNNPLQGAKFEIYEGDAAVPHDKTGAPLAAYTFTSKVTPEVLKKLTVEKWYVLVETAAPSGYTIADRIAFKLNADGTISYGTTDGTTYTEINAKASSIVVKDVQTKITIAKAKYSITGAGLAGAELELVDAGTGTVIRSWVSTTSEETIKGLEIDKEYILREKTAPDGYRKSMEIRFKIDSITGDVILEADYKDPDGNVYTDGSMVELNAGYVWSDGKIIMVDEGVAGLEILKTNAAGVPLSGATLEIYPVTTSATEPADGTYEYEYVLEGAVYYYIPTSTPYYAQWISTTTAKVFKSDDAGAWVTPSTKYLLVEKQAPEGYKTFSPKLIESGNEGEIKSYKFDDAIDESAYFKTSVSITKVDENGVMVVDAELEIYAAAIDAVTLEPFKDSSDTDKYVTTGSVLESWKTDGTAHVLTGDGTKWKRDEWFVLREKSAPEGYEKAADVIFKVKKEGELTPVTMVDPKKIEPTVTPTPTPVTPTPTTPTPTTPTPTKPPKKPKPTEAPGKTPDPKDKNEPTPVVQPTVATVTPAVVNNVNVSPKTYDGSMPGLWLALMAVGMFITTISAFALKRKRK